MVLSARGRSADGDSRPRRAAAVVGRRHFAGARRCLAEPAHVVVAVNHPLARSKQLTLRGLLDYPIAAPTAFGGSRAIFDAAWEEAGLTCTPMIETKSMHVLAGFLAAGEGVSIIALSRAQMYVDSGILTVIPVAGAALTVGRSFANLDQGA